MQTWNELQQVQPLASKIMMNSIKRNRLSHAYLVQGSRGTGKKSFARLIAMTLLCEARQGVDPCQTCNTCHRIMTGNHPDLHWIEPDGRTIRNEQIDLLRKEFAYTGLETTQKIYIVSNAETLTVNAANRILKFLEEPDVETTAILLTDNGRGIIPTIRSRCQVIDFQPLDQTAFRNRLMSIESESITENNARLLSALTNNIDEAILYHQEETIYHVRDVVKQLVYELIVRYPERYLFVHQKWIPALKERKEQELGLDLLIIALKDVVYAQMGREDETFLFQSGDGLLERAIYEFTQKRLLQMLKDLLHARQKMNQNVHPTLVIEQLVLQF